MSLVYICNLEEMPRHVKTLAVSHLISIITPAHLPPTPPEVEPENHLQIGCHDIVAPYPDAIHPDETHIARIIAFARQWDRRAPLLVHCWAGVSRSMATALTVGCIHSDASEIELTQRLRKVAPHAHPNSLIIEIADHLLGRDGALIAAVEDMGFGSIPDRAPLVEFNLDF